jgi:fucose 4-O-acetylase-like acetyltransferase
MFRPLVFRLVERHWRLWPLALGLFLAAAWVVYPSPLTHLGPLTLAISLTGIAGFLLLARHVSAHEMLAAPLRWIGGATLYIYVMHKLVIFYSDLAMSYTGTHFRGDEILQLLVTVPLCALVGGWIAAQPALGWLFAAPWVQGRPRRRAEPQPMLAE